MKNKLSVIDKRSADLFAISSLNMSNSKLGQLVFIKEIIDRIEDKELVREEYTEDLQIDLNELSSDLIVYARKNNVDEVTTMLLDILSKHFQKRACIFAKFSN